MATLMTATFKVAFTQDQCDSVPFGIGSALAQVRLNCVASTTEAVRLWNADISVPLFDFEVSRTLNGVQRKLLLPNALSHALNFN